MRYLKPASAIVAMIILIGGGLFLRQQRIAERLATPPPVPHAWALHTVEVKEDSLSEGFPALATVTSSDEITIRPRISGIIEKIGPLEGKTVKKDALLAMIDTTELRKNLIALKAALTSAIAQEKYQRLELERTKKLVAKGFASLEKRDQLVATLEAASGKREQLKAQIAELETRIAYGEIRSPVDGRITLRNQTIGDLANPATVIYKLNVATGAKVKIVVPQEILSGLHVGSDVVLTYAGKSRTIHLTRLYPALDTLSMGTAEADLKQVPFDLPSGARIAARVIVKRFPNVLLLPLLAVARSADDRHGIVFKIRKDAKDKVDLLSRVEVEIIASGFEGLAVTGDIHPGERVVSAHQSILLRLKDNDPVQPFPITLRNADEQTGN